VALRVRPAGPRLVGGLCRALTHRCTTNNFLCHGFFDRAHNKQFFQQFYKIHKKYQINLKKLDN
jgi:hypothetical protein